MIDVSQLIESWQLRASVLHEKGRQEATYSKKQRDLWKLKSRILLECAEELSALCQGPGHVKALDTSSQG